MANESVEDLEPEDDELDDAGQVPNQARVAHRQTKKELRTERQAREAAEARAAANEAAARKLAFLEAGVDTKSNPAAQLLIDHYDGDLTAEAIQAAAEKYGITGTTSATSTNQPATLAETHAAEAAHYSDLGGSRADVPEQSEERERELMRATDPTQPWEVAQPLIEAWSKKWEPQPPPD